jgi:uncharacterized protein
MRYRVAGSGVLLTGASSGIGRCLAGELARKGAHLAIAARRADRLDAVADEIAAMGLARPATFVVDLERRGNAAELTDAAERAFGQVDVLINNAGGGVGGLQWVGGDRDEGREVFEVNLWSPLALVRALVPAMRQRRSGVVVNVTSMAQVMTWPAFGHYAASKAALAMATETLRQELAGSGVHVLEVIPGPVDTAIQGETRLIPGIERALRASPLGNPAVLAQRIVSAIEHGRSRIVFPRVLTAAYLLPGVTRAYIGRQVRRVSSELNSDDARWIRSGSMGDQVAREARDAWERRQGRAGR